MIAGIGTDIVEIERMRRFLSGGQRHFDRIFTLAEQEIADQKTEAATYYAGRFAAKEAVAKALGPPFSWHDVEILRGPAGQPEIHLHGRAAETAAGMRVHVSISHSATSAIAMAVAEEFEKGSAAGK